LKTWFNVWKRRRQDKKFWIVVTVGVIKPNNRFAELDNADKKIVWGGLEHYDSDDSMRVDGIGVLYRFRTPDVRQCWATVKKLAVQETLTKSIACSEFHSQPLGFPGEHEIHRFGIEVHYLE